MIYSNDSLGSPNYFIIINNTGWWEYKEMTMVLIF